MELLGPNNESDREFLLKLGCKISVHSGDDRQASFLFQRLSILIQLINAILQQCSFLKQED